MPRTGGVYNPPAGTKGVSNTTIQSVPYNAFVDDLTDDANAPRPITAGGTGATSASGARTALGLGTAATQDVGTSGATVPLLNGNNVHSGTNTFNGQTNVNVEMFLYGATGVNLALWMVENNVRRGLIYYDATSDFVGVNVYDSSNVLKHSAVMAESGLFSWSGMISRFGSLAGDVQQQFYVDANTQFRWYYAGDNSATLQVSFDGFATNSTTMMSVDGLGNAHALSWLVNNVAASERTAGISRGNGDAAGYTTNNLWIDSGWGIGFRSSLDNTCRIFAETRTGEFVVSYRLWSGNSYLGADGDLYMPWATSLLSAVLGTKAIVHTGSNANETNYPIGYTLPMFTSGSSVNRNATVSPCLSAVDNIYFREVGDASAGTALSGTWRSRGMFGSDYAIVERVA